MKKVLFSLLAVFTASGFTLTNNSAFQDFDNEANIGLGWSSTNLKYGDGTALPNGWTNTQQSGLVDLEVEHLFSDRIWVDVNTNLNFEQGNGQSNASNYGINGKVGYAFTFNSHLQVTPYGIVGLNNDGFGGTNVGYSNIVTTPSNQENATPNQMFITGGGGARIEYRIDNIILVYADQDAVYNSDQGAYGPYGGAQNNYQETSTIGAKFNIVDNFQLGVKGFYNSYQYQTNGVSNNALQAMDGYGGLVTFGMTY